MSSNQPLIEELSRIECIADYSCHTAAVRRDSESEGLPDGATIDADGRLWSALWNGACIVRLLPNGQIDKGISLPTRKISSLTFGGEQYGDNYITTAGGNTKHEDGALAGALFRRKTEARGRPEFFSRVRAPSVASNGIGNCFQRKDK